MKPVPLHKEDSFRELLNKSKHSNIDLARAVLEFSEHFGMEQYELAVLLNKYRARSGLTTDIEARISSHIEQHCDKVVKIIKQMEELLEQDDTDLSIS